MSKSESPETPDGPSFSIAGRLCILILFFAWMGLQWHAWPLGGELLGPLAMTHFGGHERDGVVLTVIILPMMCTFLFRPNPVTLLISAIGIALWIAAGVLAVGIAC